jgi:hypothetical protein
MVTRRASTPAKQDIPERLLRIMIMREFSRRVFLAFRVFFDTLFYASVAEQVTRIFAPAGPPLPTPAPQPKPSPAAKPPARREALTLLAALQREARLVDFVQESLTGYSDAQIGAVARDVHRDCAALLERLFGLRPAVEQAEGAEVEIPAGFDPNRWRLTGNVTGEPPFRGRLVHPGWEATICEVPTWSGDPAAARIVAPAEVELR